jgi:hypothetical protein
VYENGFLDRWASGIFEFSGNEFELSENKIERERESIISLIRQEPLNRVIIFWKSHNISERYYFGTRKHIELGLNFSLVAGPKMLSPCWSDPKYHSVPISGILRGSWKVP